MSNKFHYKIFDNADFGYYKVTIERPLRLAVQMTPELIATLRFVPAMQEIMEWAYQKWGDDIYSNLAEYKNTINEYIEKEEISITAKNKKALQDIKTWQKQKDLLAIGEQLSLIIGDRLFMDFNEFSNILNDAIKQLGLKLSSSEKNQITNAVSWREEKAEKVIKKVHKLKEEKLEQLLEHLETTEEHLPDFGYWKTDQKGEWIEYESDSEIRDTENVPLKEKIHEYFLREVRPHVEDAWINWVEEEVRIQESGVRREIEWGFKPQPISGNL